MITMSPCLDAARQALHRDLTETLRLLRIARRNADVVGVDVHQDRLDAMLDQLSALVGGQS